MNPADLRYCVGVMLPEDRPDASENLKTLLENGFKEMVLPAVDHAVLTSFPFNNTISIFIGVARVYPKLADYIQVLFLFLNTMLLSVITCLLSDLNLMLNVILQVMTNDSLLRRKNYVPIL